MKRFKRLAALALSAVMTAGMMALPVAADEPSSSNFQPRIVVLDAVESVDYTAYRLFDLKYTPPTADEPNGNYIYTIQENSPWYGFFTRGSGSDYVHVTSMPMTDESGASTSVHLVEATSRLTEETAAQLAQAAIWELDLGGALEMPGGGNILAQAGQSTLADDSAGGGDNTGGGSDAGDVGGDSGSGAGIDYNEVALTVVAQDSPEYAAVLAGLGTSQTGMVAINTGDIPMGYYLVRSGVTAPGALVALNTTDTRAVIYAKTAKATMEKEIWKGNDEPSDYFSDNRNWGKAKDAQVGDDLYYRITIMPGDTSDNLTLKDLISRKINVDYDSMKVYKYVNGKETLLQNGEDYKLYINPEELDYGSGDDASAMGALYNRYENTFPHLYTFGFAFSNALCENLHGSDTIVITYHATLTDDAYLISDYGADAAGASINENGQVTRFVDQLNTATLGSSGLHRDTFEHKIKNDSKDAPWPRFGNGDEVDMSSTPATSGANITFYDKNGNVVTPNGWTPIATSGAAALLYGFDLVKVDGKQMLIDGATFQLYAADPEGNADAAPISLVKVNDMHGWQVGSKYGPAGEVYRPALGGETGVTDIQIGFATIVGLDSGTYWVKETEAPAGYTKMASAQKITLISGTSIWDNAGLAGSENTSGADSTIRDTEIAGEMVGYTQNNVLAQAAQSMLAKSTSTEKLSSKYNINRAGDDAPGLAISEKLQSQNRGLSQAWKNLCPMVIEGGGYNLTGLGCSDNCTTAMALCHKGEDGQWYYGSDGTVTLQIGANKDQCLGGENSITGSAVIEGGLGVVNLTGIELPHTGGIGTTIFYVVGGLLVVGAGVLLIVKKRMKDEE